MFTELVLDRNITKKITQKNKYMSRILQRMSVVKMSCKNDYLNFSKVLFLIS